MKSVYDGAGRISKCLVLVGIFGWMVSDSGYLD